MLLNRFAAGCPFNQQLCQLLLLQVFFDAQLIGQTLAFLHRLHCFGDSLLQVRNFDRLLYIIDCGQPDGAFQIFHIQIPAHEQQLAVRTLLPQLFGKSNSVQLRHPDIRQHDFRLVLCCQPQRLCPVSRFNNLLNAVSAPFHRINQAFSCIIIIICN
ncbi:hypothetical protein D3C80_1610090 [compost metagenome]